MILTFLVLQRYPVALSVKKKTPSRVIKKSFIKVFISFSYINHNEYYLFKSYKDIHICYTLYKKNIIILISIFFYDNVAYLALRHTSCGSKTFKAYK